MNSSMNRLGFGGTATGHFHFQNNDMEDMLVHNTAKLQLSVHMKSRTHSAILHNSKHSKERTWTNMEMLSFAPEEFFFRGWVQIGVPRYIQEK